MSRLGEPDVRGPVSGGAHGWPFAATVRDLDACGYVEEEYHVQGEAERYHLAGASGYGFDGRWRAEPSGTIRYGTRILVRRPKDPARFNGTTLVSWTNVSSGFDNVADLSDEVTESGFAQVCVSAQRVGLHGFPFGASQGLLVWDPNRYGGLSIPDDDGSYGVFLDAARLAPALTGLEGKLVAVGGSQSAKRLATYYNAVQPIRGPFDGFILDVYMGSGALLDASDPGAPRHDFGPATDLINGLPESSHLLRDDIGVPVLVLNSETEAAAYLPVRLPDGDCYRLWEVAGAAHGSSDRWAEVGARMERDFGATAMSTAGDADRNMIALDPVREAALAQVHRWVHGGKPPPIQPRLELAGDPPKIVRDDLGNAVGGIRLPDLDVPVAAHSGERTAPADLFGRSVPFSDEVLRSLYPDPATFSARYDDAVSAAVASGVILARDADRLRRRIDQVPRPLRASSPGSAP